MYFINYNSISTTPSKERIQWIHLLRCFGAFSVVVIHVTYPVTSKLGKTNPDYWGTGLLIEAVFRSGVAIFLMLSGALLLHKTKEPVIFLKKRLHRVLPAFLIWSIAYLYLDKAFEKLELGDLLLNIVLGASVHLWYVKTAILLYLVIAVFGNKLSALSRKNVLRLLLLVEITVLLSLTYREQLWLNEIRGFLSCVVYLLLGFYLYKIEIQHQQKRRIGFLLFFLGVSSTLLLTYGYSEISGKYQDFFFSLLAPNILLKAAGTFLIFSSLKYQSSHTSDLTKNIARTSFGIYLIHPLVIDYLLFPMGIYHSYIHPMIGIPLTSLLCFAISFLFLFFISKFRFGNYLM